METTNEVYTRITLDEVLTLVRIYLKDGRKVTIEKHGTKYTIESTKVEKVKT